jgi:hypothetical protein
MVDGGYYEDLVFVSFDGLMQAAGNSNVGKTRQVSQLPEFGGDSPTRGLLRGREK